MPHHAGTARYQYQYNQNDLGLASTVDWDHVIVIGGPLLFYLNKWKGVAEWVHEMGREEWLKRGAWGGLWDGDTNDISPH